MQLFKPTFFLTLFTFYLFTTPSIFAYHLETVTIENQTPFSGLYVTLVSGNHRDGHGSPCQIGQTNSQDIQPNGGGAIFVDISRCGQERYIAVTKSSGYELTACQDTTQHTYQLDSSHDYSFTITGNTINSLSCMGTRLN